MEKRLGRPLPREAIGLAINSSVGRSQDQLHIHIDCVAPAISAALAAHSAELTSEWRPLSFDLAGRRYVARKLESADLSEADPFRTLADGDEGAREHMALETLVAIGARFAEKDGFILLADRADPAAGDMAHGEDLLDHSCAIAK
jgi:CDP-diacylglycerol pyrophosphatase